MRRSILTAIGLLALVLAAPSAALAHHGHGHHHHHHHHHKAHHAQIRFMHIGSGGERVTASPNSATPTVPTTPTTPTPPNAGTVASYTGGVLTLTLNDGSSVSGKVTEDTKIECAPEPPTTPPSGAPGPPTDGEPGDDNGQGDDQSRGDMNQQGEKGPGEWPHGNQGSDDGEEVKAGSEPPCDSSLLVAGTAVRAAELRIGPSGNEFENVLLVR